MSSPVEQHPHPGSVIGEYLLIFDAAHALVCAGMWVLICDPDLTCIAAVSANVWIVIRWLGGFRRYLMTFAVTVSLWSICVLASPDSANSVPVVFSLPVIGAMLLIVMANDAIELVVQLQSPERIESTRRFVLRHGIRILAICVCFLVFVLPVVLALIEEFTYRETSPPVSGGQAMDRLTLPLNVLLRLCGSLTAFSFFVIGTCVGSFLNVVIYRVPLGVSTFAKPSHCPGCSRKIAGRDNIPLIGWLRLNGQCRTCSIEISGRYPSIELAIGLVFLVFYYVQLISGGANLAGRIIPPYTGVLWVVFFTQWDLVYLYLYHCALFCTIISWSVMRFDGNRVPLFSTALMLSVFILAPLIVPCVQPYPPGVNGAALPSLSATGMTSLLGMVAGAGAACLLQLLRPVAPPTDAPSWLLLGAAPGWCCPSLLLHITCAGK